MHAELEAYRAAMVARIGMPHRHHLGIVDERMIRRYARAIGDSNPIYHDAAAARAAGYDNIVAPPNMLASIADWSAGLPEEELTPDGIARSGDTGSLRVMGAGEEMELVRPVTAGVDLYNEETIERVDVKEGKSGTLVFVTAMHEFTDAPGNLINRNRRTVLARV